MCTDWALAIQDVVTKAIGVSADRVRVFCSNSQESTTRFKTRTLEHMVSFGAEYDLVVHFEDKLDVLTACDSAIRHLAARNQREIRYIGVHVNETRSSGESHSFRPIQSADPTIHIAIVGPPASGKTSIFEELGRRAAVIGKRHIVISFDLEDVKLRELAQYSDRTIKIPADVKFEAVQKARRSGILRFVS